VGKGNLTDRGEVLFVRTAGRSYARPTSCSFIPDCVQPFNRFLHSLCSNVLVIRSKSNMNNLSGHMRLAKYVAIHGHKTPKVFPHTGEMVLMVVKTPGKVFAICPRAFPETLDEAGKILQG
jgi:hypothetical protein